LKRRLFVFSVFIPTWKKTARLDRKEEGSKKKKREKRAMGKIMPSLAALRKLCLIQKKTKRRLRRRRERGNKKGVVTQSKTFPMGHYPLFKKKFFLKSLTPKGRKGTAEEISKRVESRNNPGGEGITPNRSAGRRGVKKRHIGQPPIGHRTSNIYLLHQKRHFLYRGRGHLSL